MGATYRKNLQHPHLLLLFQQQIYLLSLKLALYYPAVNLWSKSFEVMFTPYRNFRPVTSSLKLLASHGASRAFRIKFAFFCKQVYKQSHKFQLTNVGTIRVSRVSTALVVFRRPALRSNTIEKKSRNMLLETQYDSSYKTYIIDDHQLGSAN